MPLVQQFPAMRSPCEIVSRRQSKALCVQIERGQGLGLASEGGDHAPLEGALAGIERHHMFNHDGLAREKRLTGPAVRLSVIERHLHQQRCRRCQALRGMGRKGDSVVVAMTAFIGMRENDLCFRERPGQHVNDWNKVFRDLLIGNAQGRHVIGSDAGKRESIQGLTPSCRGIVLGCREAVVRRVSAVQRRAIGDMDHPDERKLREQAAATQHLVVGVRHNDQHRWGRPRNAIEQTLDQPLVVSSCAHIGSMAGVDPDPTYRRTMAAQKSANSSGSRGALV